MENDDVNSKELVGFYFPCAMGNPNADANCF